MNMEVEATETCKPEPADGWEWAIVEVFGHRRHAGRCREEERFGAKMLRIDIPVIGSTQVQLPASEGPRDSWIERWETRWYGGSSIFSYTLTDEASVMRANKSYEPPSPYRLPAPEPDDDDPSEVEEDLDDAEAVERLR